MTQAGLRGDVAFLYRVSALCREEAAALLAQKRITLEEVNRLQELWRVRAMERERRERLQARSAA